MALYALQADEQGPRATAEKTSARCRGTQVLLLFSYHLNTSALTGGNGPSLYPQSYETLLATVGLRDLEGIRIFGFLYGLPVILTPFRDSGP